MTTKHWRAYLKPDETTRISELDAVIAAHRLASTTLTAEREIIRRRAVARIIREAGKGGV